MRFVEPVRNFYDRFEHTISSFFLVGGFIFDAFTLRRVDRLSENAWIAGYLVIIAVTITLIHLKERRTTGGEGLGKAHFWYVNILQFAFGGVFSAYLVLYFRSADILVAWPFIALLAATFIANEFLKKHYVRLSFQISLFFLAIYWFMIFLVPVVLHRIGPSIFLLSGLISLGAISLFIKILFYFIKDDFVKSKKLVVTLVTLVVILVNTLYFTNLIPPIPLSLKDAGVYHSIQKIKEGSYEVAYEEYGWRKYFNLYPDFHKTPGGAVYAYSAIYSPKNLNLTIVHEWERLDESQKKWIPSSVISLPVIGGRGGGFRTYSVRSNLEEGKWRVNVKTKKGQIIGRINFNVVAADTEPELTKKTK